MHCSRPTRGALGENTVVKPGARRETTPGAARPCDRIGSVERVVNRVGGAVRRFSCPGCYCRLNRLAPQQLAEAGALKRIAPQPVRELSHLFLLDAQPLARQGGRLLALGDALHRAARAHCSGNVGTARRSARTGCVAVERLALGSSATVDVCPRCTPRSRSQGQEKCRPGTAGPQDRRASEDRSIV